MRKLAVKKLKSSDLSFFEHYLKLHPSSKQKGFNLDRKVLEGQFFPSLRALLEPLYKKSTAVDLMFFGPGLASVDTMTRKIKIDSKNFRLNGEFVHAPIEDPTRYDDIVPGDFAVMEFTGAAVPEQVKVVLIAAANEQDAAIHAAFQALLPSPKASMRVIDDDELEALVLEANPSPEHPIREWLDTVLLEEVGSGDAEAVARLNTRRPGRGLTQAELKASKEAAEATGQLGEELLDQHLTEGLDGLVSYEWVASVNAISPFDFLLTFDSSFSRHVDAKSTSGEFSNPVYLSIGEIRHAVASGVPYDIYRLYEVKQTSAKLRIASDIGPQLADVLTALDALPDGVKVDKLSFAPSFFVFGDEVTQILSSPEDDAEDGWDD